MREVLVLAIHLLVTVAKLMRPGGARAVCAESLLLKLSAVDQQSIQEARFEFDRVRSFSPRADHPVHEPPPYPEARGNRQAGNTA